MSSSKLDVTGDRLLRTLSYDWKPVDPIIEELVHTVAPGVAMRRYADRVRQRVERGDVKNPRVLTDYDAQMSGARSIVNDRIHTQKSSGRIELGMIDGVRCIRLLRQDTDDACPACKRPFQQAAKKRPRTTPPETKTTRQPRPKVVYPNFPQWQPTKRVAVGGSSE